MTSTALKYKSNFKSAFVKVFKQKIFMLIALLLLSLTVSLFAMTMEILSNSLTLEEATASVPKSVQTIDETQTALIVAAAATAVCGFFSLIIAPEMFREIYKKQACDHYFAIPVKRSEIFCANFLYGVLANAAAFIVSIAVFAVGIYSASTKYFKYSIDFDALLPAAAVMLLAVLAIYSAFVMCAVTAGKRFHYIVMSIICLLCAPFVINGIISNLNKIWGLYIGSTVLDSVSPIENAIMSFSECYSRSEYYSGDNALLVSLAVVSVAEIIGMFAAGYLIFKRRTAESAEIAPYGSIIPYALMALGGAALFMQGNTYKSAALSAVLGTIFAVLCVICLTAIFYKKPFTKQTGITAAAVCILCSFVTIGSSLPIYSHYINRVPDAEQVESVEFYDLSQSFETISLLETSPANGYDPNAVFEIKEKENTEKG